MSRPGRGSALAAAAFVLLLVSGGCVRHRAGAAAGPTYGLYSGSFRGSDARELKFRLWLFAQTPDRIHAEVLGPAGGARLIVDGGGGAIAVTFVDAGESYVGSADPEHVGAALGVRTSLDELVAALRTGAPAGRSGVEFRREPVDGTGYPRRFEAGAAGGRLTLSLRGERPLGAPADSLGTGTPPPGTRILPIEALPAGPWADAPAEGADR